MFERIDSVLRDGCGLRSDRPVLAGISGGPDSLCLLDLLHRNGYAVIVAHFNHRLRPEADREAAAVSALTRTLGLSFVTASLDVHAYAGSHNLSLEEAARKLRYRFLFAAARKRKAQAVAVGHTADDQVETVLMHLLRGAGSNGLKGMALKTVLPEFDAGIPLVRPLLGVWRSETEAYCREHGLQPVYDASNEDQTYLRNRLRHALIPELETYNPRFKEAVLRTAQALQADVEALEGILNAAWNEVVVGGGEGWVAFDRAALLKLSIGLQRNLIRRAAEGLYGANLDVGFDVLARAAAFLADPGKKRIDLVNGLYLCQERERIYLAGLQADLPSAQWPQVTDCLDLPLPGQLDLGNGWLLSAQEEKMTAAVERARTNDDPFQARLDGERLLASLGGTGDRLTVRAAPAGERFQPLGMAGHSLKLSDFFVNVKLPKRARKGWPVVYAKDIPAWVAGYRVAHPFRVTEKTGRVVRLVLQKM